MADKDLLFNDGQLASTDRVRYVEIAPGVYALATAPTLPTDVGLYVVPTPFHHAASGRRIDQWINDLIVGVAAPTTLANGPVGDQPGVYYNLEPNTRVFITQFVFGVQTVNDNCYFELGWVDGANALGTFTPISSFRYVFTGGAIAGYTSQGEDFVPPIGPLNYGDGVRSITVRVSPNDITCQIMAAWRGWWEPE
jgi:hypothetical protein